MKPLNSRNKPVSWVAEVAPEYDTWASTWNEGYGIIEGILKAMMMAG